MRESEENDSAVEAYVAVDKLLVQDDVDFIHIDASSLRELLSCSQTFLVSLMRTNSYQCHDGPGEYVHPLQPKAGEL